MGFKTLAIIQARMKSSRLPDKVMLDIAGKPMLQRVVERTARARLVDRVVVATTTGADEDPIADLCGQLGVPCYRGSLQDVLDRYYQCALQFTPDIVVRITADCPVMDPGLIDETVSVLTGKYTGSSIWQPQGDPQDYQPPTHPAIPWDYASTRLPPPWERSYPIGLDVEVCTFNALEKAWRESVEPHQREHVLPYLYEVENHYRCIVGGYQPGYGRLRWTVDTPADLEFIRQVYAMMPGEDFGWLDVLKLVQEHPELTEINAEIRHKHYREVDDRK